MLLPIGKTWASNMLELIHSPLQGFKIGLTALQRIYRVLEYHQMPHTVTLLLYKLTTLFPYLCIQCNTTLGDADSNFYVVIGVSHYNSGFSMVR